MASVVSINSSEKKGTVKLPSRSGLLLENGGLKGDAHAGDGHRQLSLLDSESILEIEELSGEEISFGSFAENITTKGICLSQLPISTRLVIGKSLIEITQIGKQCHADCEIKKRVGKCVMPQRGVFARVIRGGEIFVGDEISVEGSDF